MSWLVRLTESGNLMDKIVDGLFVGSFEGAKEKSKLLENKITHILCVHHSPKAIFPDDFVYKCIEVSDDMDSDLSVFFDESVDFIHESRLRGGNVLVHCASGMSRSVSITVCYIMVVSTLNLDESFAVVQHCRNLASPNFGFRRQLREFQDKNLEQARKRVQENFPNYKDLMEKDEKQLREILGRQPT